MAQRACPACGARISAASAAAFPNNIECPACKTRLEVGTGGRMIGSVLGLIAGWLAWRYAPHAQGALDDFLPVVYAFLAFGVVSALALMMTAGLQSAPLEPVAAPAPAGGHGHNSIHH